MPTNREIYFGLLKLNNKYINSAVAKEIVLFANGFIDDLSFTLGLDKECKNIDWVKVATSLLLEGKPIQYITGKAYFNGDVLSIDENVLIPRQETEELVRITSTIINDKWSNGSLSIVDVCTGSGAIALSIKKEFPSADVYASDISDNALNIAIKNAEFLNRNITFSQGDLLSPYANKNRKFDVIISNPPYIDKIETIDEQVWKYEPHLALLAYPSTIFYEKILEESKSLIRSVHVLAFEIGEDMKESLFALAKMYYPNDKVSFKQDIYGKDRFMFIESIDENKKAAKALLDGGVISLPTETVMGLGVIYDDKVAYEKLNQIKSRPETKPYSMMLGNVEDIEKYAYVNERDNKIIKAFLPGPLTVLLKVKENVPMWVTHGTGIIGIRVPSNKAALGVLQEVKKPLLVPSANRSGKPPLMTYEEVINEFGTELDYIYKENTEGGLPSTLLDLTKEQLCIIRQGPITLEMIEKAIK